MHLSPLILSLLLNGAIFTALFTNTQDVFDLISDSVEVLEPVIKPVIKPAPKPAPVSEKAVKVLIRVVCGEVGPHHRDTGENVLQVIANRATLKAKFSKISLAKAMINVATAKVGGTPQFARHCRSDGRADWQREIAIKALRGAFVSKAPWMTEKTLFFRTHVGAPKWEKKKGWTKNIFKVGADKYHTFFSANQQAVNYMARY